MEIDKIDKKQRLRLMLSNLFGEELLSLDEVAKLLKVSEFYLLGLIRKGKIKAFKIEDYWFIKFDWVKQFRQEIYQHIFEEVSQLDNLNKKKWIKPIKQKKIILPPFFIFSCRLITTSFLLAMMTLAFALMVPFPEKIIIGKNYFLLKILSITETSTQPIKYFSQLTIPQSKINDEKLTQWLRSFFNNYNNRGQVAGESEIIDE